MATDGGGFDLAALNMQRGRDHGLPRFNQVRLDYGLPAYTSFSDISSRSRHDRTKLASAYNTVDDIDAWVGLLVETHQPNAAGGAYPRSDSKGSVRTPARRRPFLVRSLFGSGHAVLWSNTHSALRHHPPQHNHYNGDSNKRLGFCSAYTTADSYCDSEPDPDSKPDAVANADSNARRRHQRRPRARRRLQRLNAASSPDGLHLNTASRTRRQPAITRSRGRIPSYIRK